MGCLLTSRQHTLRQLQHNPCTDGLSVKWEWQRLCILASLACVVCSEQARGFAPEPALKAGALVPPPLRPLSRPGGDT